jgi:hypothetical protein
MSAFVNRALEREVGRLQLLAVLKEHAAADPPTPDEVKSARKRVQAAVDLEP